MPTDNQSTNYSQEIYEAAFDVQRAMGINLTSEQRDVIRAALQAAEERGMGSWMGRREAGDGTMTENQSTIEKMMPNIVACSRRALMPNGEVKSFQPILMTHDVTMATYILDEMRAAGFEIIRNDHE